jgi:predicted phosphoribosyltransferase
MTERFRDRAEAGDALTAHLADLPGVRDAVVLGLPRGGVPVAARVARGLALPLDVLVARKLGVPWRPELAFGAVAEDGARFVDERLVARLGVSARQVAEVEAAELAELDRRAAAYRRGRPRLPLTGRTALVVDDGVATGATAIAACRSARTAGAAVVVVAVPVAPPGWERAFRQEADGTVAVSTPADFEAVGDRYRRFEQTTDAEVLAALDGG